MWTLSKRLNLRLATGLKRVSRPFAVMSWHCAVDSACSQIIPACHSRFLYYIGGKLPWFISSERPYTPLPYHLLLKAPQF